MPEEIKLIQRVAVERDQDGWWSHPDEPDFDEDYAAFKAWLVQQGLELKQWHMDSDIGEHHPYDDGECHCLGWEPECPGPEWFLLGIFDTEDGPCVSWARRKAEEAWSLNGDDGSWDYPSLTALIRDNFGSAADGTSFGPGRGKGLKEGTRAPRCSRWGPTMTRLALCLLLLATGASATENVIDVQHDSQRGVICYILNHVGISCIPDSQLQAGNERQLSPHEQQPEPTPALAPERWIDERHEL